MNLKQLRNNERKETCRTRQQLHKRNPILSLIDIDTLQSSWF